MHLADHAVVHRFEQGCLSITPVSPVLGAEIAGVDLSQPLAAASVRAIRDALATYGVVFFRDQHLSPEQHLALARNFGSIDVNRFITSAPGYPAIAEIRKDPEHKKNMGGNWHTDQSYDAAPALGSILVARELPSTGGDTLFASMYAAYDALSDGLKQTLAGMRALHSSRHVFGYAGRNRAEPELATRIGNPELALQDAVHPVVIRHPEQRPPGTLRQSELHAPVRRLDGRGIAAIARLSVSARRAARIRLPLQLAARLDRVLGQPCHLALRHQRLSGRASADAPPSR